MLQLKTPLSPAESDLLLKCLSDMENDLRDRRTCSKQDLAKQTTIASAKQKVASHIYDSFYRDEITHMVFALDSLTRKYREQLTENIPPAQAEAVGAELRTAAIVLSKLKRANPQKHFLFYALLSCAGLPPPAQRRICLSPDRCAFFFIYSWQLPQSTDRPAFQTAAPRDLHSAALLHAAAARRSYPPPYWTRRKCRTRAYPYAAPQ